MLAPTNTPNRNTQSAAAARRTRNTRLAAAIAVDGRQRYLIAALAGIAPQVLAGCVSGRVEPTVAQRDRIAGVLGVDAADVFGEVL